MWYDEGVWTHVKHLSLMPYCFIPWVFFIFCALLRAPWVPKKSLRQLSISEPQSVSVCRACFLVRYSGFWRAVIVCGSVFMLEDTREACLSSHKWTEDMREAISPLFVPSTSTFLSASYPVFFLFWVSDIFIPLSSFLSHVIFRSFPLTSSYPSSSVTFSDWSNVRPHQSERLRRSRSVSPSVPRWNVTQEQALSLLWAWNELPITWIGTKEDGLSLVSDTPV